MKREAKPKPEAAPEGWIATGHCFYCHREIETLHPAGNPPQVRHIADKRKYLDCDSARKARNAR